MSSIRILAILFILGGVFGLAYGSFSFTKETHEAKIGALELSVDERENVHIPPWVSVLAIGAGVGLFFLDRSKAGT